MVVKKQNTFHESVEELFYNLTTLVAHLDENDEGFIPSSPRQADGKKMQWLKDHTEDAEMHVPGINTALSYNAIYQPLANIRDELNDLTQVTPLPGPAIARQVRKLQEVMHGKDGEAGLKHTLLAAKPDMGELIADLDKSAAAVLTFPEAAQTTADTAPDIIKLSDLTGNRPKGLPNKPR